MTFYRTSKPDMAAEVRGFPLSLPAQADPGDHAFKRMVYMGRSVEYVPKGKGKGSPLVNHLWLTEDGETVCYEGKDGDLKTSARSGMVYAVLLTLDGQGVRYGPTAGPFFLGSLIPPLPLRGDLCPSESWTQVETRVVEWHATDRGQGNRLTNLKTERALKTRNLVQESLLPLQQAYSQTSTQGREVLIAQVIEFLTRGVR